MKSTIFRIMPAIIFAGVAVLAIAQNQDYVEAAIWIVFALAVVLPALPANGDNKRRMQLISVILLFAGIILLVLRMLNILPEPVRPLP